MDSAAPTEERGAQERTLVALAGALILLASARVTLPLLAFAAAVAALALPMSSLIAWMSRFEARGGETDDDDVPAEWDAYAPAVVAEPPPRPLRPAEADPHTRGN